MAPKKGSGVSSASFGEYENLIVNPTDLADKFGYWSTGSPSADRLLGGGITKGRMSELYGREQSGKSTFCLSISREVIKVGGRVLYIDLERGLEVRKPGQGSWLEINGINAFDGTFSIIQQVGKEPISAEVIYDILIGAVRDKRYEFIVVDSMAAMVTRAELAGEIGDATFGSVARINSQGLKTLHALQGSNHETSICWINQVRDQLQGGMGGLKSTGGRSLPHYVHQKLRFDKTNRAAPQKDGDFLTPVRLRVEKARGTAASEVELTISAKRGLDVLAELLEAGKASGRIEVKGAWYRIVDGENELFKAQGELPIKKFISEHPDLYETLYKEAAGTANIILVEDDSE